MKDERDHYTESERASMKPFVEKAERLMEELHNCLLLKLKTSFTKIKNETGFEEFLVVGSWASMVIADALGTICIGDGSFDSFILRANEIDVFYSNFVADSDKSLSVMLDCIEYHDVEG